MADVNKREYELIAIVTPEVSLEQAKEIVEGILKDFEATITHLEVKGRQDLQYERKKHSSGIFVEVRFLMDKNKAPELQYRLNIHLQLLQFFLKNLARK